MKRQQLKTFEILAGGEWFKVRGIIQPSGWLDWKGKDGAVGLAPPAKFRKRPEKTKGTAK